MNRSPSIAIDFKTLQEIWSDSPFDYSDLRIFGCPTYYAHVNYGKLELKVMKCIFLGYVIRVKGYRLWCIEKKIEFQILLLAEILFLMSLCLARGKSWVILQELKIRVLTKRLSLRLKLQKRWLQMLYTTRECTGTRITEYSNKERNKRK
jgi:hypothetical protein